MQSSVTLAPNQIDQLKEQMQIADDEFAQADAQFHEQYPAYGDTSELDALRLREFCRLDDFNHVYLDYTGGGLYAASQVKEHSQMLLRGVFGNPHSSNPTSMAMTERVDRARDAVFAYFNIDRDEYEVIFTANASGALKLLGESYPFEDRGQYMLAFDNHNSMNGIREFARRASAPVTYIPVVPPDLRLDSEALERHLPKAISDGNNLFGFPAQSNFSGVQHDLKWIEIAQAHGWDVLVDCAAFAPTNRLDFGEIKPDFVPLSFYKIFGYPTGIGALIAKRSKLKKLRRPWFAGGTITIATVQGDKHFLEEGYAGFEDGTVDYLSLPAIEMGLGQLEAVGIDTIHDRVILLTGYLLDEMNRLKHSNGNGLVKIYGPLTTEGRGGTISFNLYDPDGNIFDYQQVEALANSLNISVRTGCFCNPGAGEVAMNLHEAELRASLENAERMTFEQLVEAMTAGGEHDAVGAIRASVGMVSNFRDVYLFVRFLHTFLDKPASTLSR